MGINGFSWSSIPSGVKTFLGMVTILSIGMIGGQWWATQRALPHIVESLDGRFSAFQDVTQGKMEVLNIRLFHLNCRAREDDEGRDPRVCEIILQQLPPEERQRERSLQ